jgi:hypothetical protein
MQTKHTPEPWITGGVFNPDSPNATMNIWSEPPEGKQSGVIIAKDMKVADARRARACVNALAGLKPEAIKDVVEALEKIANLKTRSFGDYYSAQDALDEDEVKDIANEALAKLKEGAC